jgi:hypothetical protein
VATEKSPESRGFSAEAATIVAESSKYQGENAAKIGNK